MNRTRSRKSETARRRLGAVGTRPKRTGRQAAARLSAGAAAAERASAGIGTADFEPTDWLFGETLGGSAARP